MVRKSLNVWSVPGGLDGSLDAIAFLHQAAEMGFEAVEYGVGDPGTTLPLDVTEARCQELVAEAARLGLTIPSLASGLYWARSIGDTDPAIRAQAVSDLKRMLQIAHWLGAKTLLVVPGAVDVFFLPDRPVQPYDQVMDNIRAGFAAVLPEAERLQVRMGIENVWNKIFLSPIELRDFIDSFGSPWLGAYVDVGNMMPWGYPEQWLRILGHRVVGVHFKDYLRAAGGVHGFVDLLQGDVNWPEVMKALSEIGYDGPAPCEMIPPYAHHGHVRAINSSRAMDAILGRS